MPIIRLAIVTVILTIISHLHYCDDSTVWPKDTNRIDHIVFINMLNMFLMQILTWNK